MEGVHILDVFPAAEPVNVILSMFVMAFIGIAISIIGSVISDFDYVGFILFGVFFCVLGGVLGIITANNINNNLRPVTYEVIVDDDVGFNEFYERYEVVERRGEIFVVKEK